MGNIQKAIPEPVKYDPTGISTVVAVPETRWAIYNLKGVIDHGTLDFSLNFGDFPTSFTGRQLLK